MEKLENQNGNGEEVLEFAAGLCYDFKGDSVYYSGWLPSLAGSKEKKFEKYHCGIYEYNMKTKNKRQLISGEQLAKLCEEEYRSGFPEEYTCAGVGNLYATENRLYVSIFDWGSETSSRNMVFSYSFEDEKWNPEKKLNQFLKEKNARVRCIVGNKLMIEANYDAKYLDGCGVDAYAYDIVTGDCQLTERCGPEWYYLHYNYFYYDEEDELYE